MTPENALGIYRLSTAREERASIRDADLALLEHAYPDLVPVFEELQYWRDEIRRIEDAPSPSME